MIPLWHHQFALRIHHYIWVTRWMHIITIVRSGNAWVCRRRYCFFSLQSRKQQISSAKRPFVKRKATFIKVILFSDKLRLFTEPTKSKGSVGMYILMCFLVSCEIPTKRLVMVWNGELFIPIIGWRGTFLLCTFLSDHTIVERRRSMVLDFWRG